MPIPVVGLCSAGYAIHDSFGKWLMTVIPFGSGKGQYYIVEQILCVLCLCLMSKSGSYPIIGKPFTL